MNHRSRALGTLLVPFLAFAAGCTTEEPQPEPAPQPVHAPPEEKDPDMRPAHARDSVGVRNDKNPILRVVFLNNFGRPHAEKVVAEMEADAEFEEILMDAQQPNRITIECKYHGTDIRQSLKRVITRTEVPFHFREASGGDLAKHVEVWRTKE